ncbi:hypothetical protein ACMHYB_33095 [Sorangium sp. So ce1128]
MPASPPRRLRRLNRVTRDGQRAILAHHEAAHAVVGAMLGVAVERIEMWRRGESRARTWVRHLLVSTSAYFQSVKESEDKRLRRFALRAIEDVEVFTLAGPCEEAIVLRQPLDLEVRSYWLDGRPVPLPDWAKQKNYLAHSDSDRARILSARVLCLDPRRAISPDEHRASMVERTLRLLRAKGVQPAIERLAERLIQEEHVDAQGIRETIGDDLVGAGMRHVRRRTTPSRYAIEIASVEF